MGHAGAVSSERKPIDLAMDLFFYAPVGASIEFWERVPALADLGRKRLSAHAPAAKTIGKFVLGVGRSRFESRLDDAVKRGREAISTYGPAGRTEPPGSGQEENGEVDQAQRPVPSGDMPIPHYDDLTAMTIVPLLENLTSEERDLVRRHETAGRGRQTILARIERLDAADPVES